MRPIAVLYENEAWMQPLFAALDDAGAPYERVFVNARSFDPTAPAPDWSLALNKVSPSSYLRGHAPSIAFARQFLPYLEERGVPVVNGTEAFRLETSKALQLLLLHRLGVRAPRTHLANDPSRLVEGARGLRFPVIVKPNVGGSGALMRRFDGIDELAGAADAIDLGPDGTVLVQEYLEPVGGSIVRVEFLDGEYLYGIRITNDREQDFNLCPADICQVPGEGPSRPEQPESAEGAGFERGRALPDRAAFDNCVVEAPAKKALRIEAFEPPGELIDAVLRIAKEGRLDVGGVEYLVSERDGLPYVYDINALSNFVTDAPALVGFDPHARFVRYLVERARSGELVR
jgi:hypothetical protein